MGISSVLTDDEIVAALRAAHTRDYTIAEVEAVDGVASMVIEQAGGQKAHLRVRLPSTGAPQWWLHAPPEDAGDWAGQFITWTDEEVDTDGLGGTRARTTIDGASHVIAENYGWRLSDQVEHARLHALAGPFGWHDGGRPVGPDGPLPVPAERELVVDGEVFLVSVQGTSHQVTWLSGPNAGYGYGGTLGGSRGMSAESIEAVVAATVGDDEHMRRNIHAFLAEIDPTTGFLRDDDET
ncbi:MULTISPECIES: hypothetical protein [unclassified Curtobacterium]|uniref:hypothetical protein n=1 Tax=unclassified Curtobacterium TaxID=257496 RepID=UPI0011B3722C|nr:MULTISPECIES: hypothetical protein [unclassified Curtobacterium]